jgi:hypothetical protein
MHTAQVRSKPITFIINSVIVYRNMGARVRVNHSNLDTFLLNYNKRTNPI